MEMTNSWELLKSKKTSPGKISWLSIEDVTQQWDILKVINHEKKIGLRVGCNFLNNENDVFKRKLPKLSQIKITWNTSNKPFLLIQLQDVSFEDQFIKFIEIIIEKIKEYITSCNFTLNDKAYLNNDESSLSMERYEEILIKTVINECFKWSYLLMKEEDRKLKLNNQKGLIAELLFLQNLFKYLDFPYVLNSWTGPDKFSKDFILNNIGFEIKSIQTGHTNKVSISNYDQLDLVGLDKLFLVTYLLSAGSKDNSLSFTLTDLVNDIRKELEYDQESLLEFENKLIVAGYFDLDDYSDCYLIKSNKPSYYSVSNNFPCITSNIIDINSIIKVRYEIDTTTLDAFILEEFIVMNNIEKNENTSNIKDESLEEKIEKGETKFVEFKQSLSLDIRKIDNYKDYSPKKEEYLNEVIIKTIIAFLNTEGGELFIGVKDYPIEIFGIDKELKMLYKSSTDEILRDIARLIKVFIGLQFTEYIDFDIKAIKNKRIIYFTCRKSSVPIYNLKTDQFFIRNGPSTEELKGRALTDYIKKRFN